jgi:outer membrane protein TolC
MKKQFLVILYLAISLSLFAQQRTLSYYQSSAHTNSPEIKENINLQKFNLLQNDIIKAQFQKPQVNFTADYLFAPFFFNNGKLVSITSNPSNKAIGYDIALTDGGLYAAQVSVTKSLFNRKSINALLTESQTENQSLQLNQTQLQHDLEKSVNEQYITVYQIQMQKEYLVKTINMLADRLLIMDALVKKNLTKQSDYLALEVELTTKLFELKQLHSSSISAISQLNSLCGISDTTVYSLAIPKIEQSIPVTKFLFEDKYLNDSLTIIAKQAVSNSKYNPQFEIFGNTGLNSTNSSTIPRNFGLTAGFHLNISIYDGLQRKITESQSKILLDNSRIYRNSYIIKIQNELLMINKQILATKESLVILEKQMVKQKSLLSSYESELAQGQISIMDYIIALQEYSSTIQNKVQTESDLWLLINQYNYLNW